MNGACLLRLNGNLLFLPDSTFCDALASEQTLAVCFFRYAAVRSSRDADEQDWRSPAAPRHRDARRGWIPFVFVVDEPIGFKSRLSYSRRHLTLSEPVSDRVEPCGSVTTILSRQNATPALSARRTESIRSVQSTAYRSVLAFSRNCNR